LHVHLNVISVEYGQGHPYIAVECKSLIYFIYTSVLLTIFTCEDDLLICVFVVVGNLNEFRLREWPCAVIFL